MGKKPKAPDMSWQIQAAQKQEAALVKQQTETDLKNEQTAIRNTEKLRGIRRRARSNILFEPVKGVAPASQLSAIEQQKADEARARGEYINLIRK
jgi:hypothetical protein